MSDVTVTREPRVYSRESPYSFFRDQHKAIILADSVASERLRRHSAETFHEIVTESIEGKRALSELGEQLRGELDSRDAIEREVRARVGTAATESRAATSSTIAGFVTPQWLVDQFALFRGTQRAFADQCTRLPIPDVGMQVNVPRFTAASSAGVQAEGGAVTELDPSGVDNAADVITIAGQILTSQQLVDRTRGMPDGPSFDLIVLKQLKDSYDQSLNNYVLGQAMNQGAKIAGQGAFTNLSAFYTDLSAAVEKLRDAAGVHIQPTHLFMTPDLYGFITRQVDDQHRPLIVPEFAPGTPIWPTEEDHDGWSQFTGTIVPGVLMWFVDATIPPAGSNTQWIVSRPESIALWEGTASTRVYSETLAGTLRIVTQLYAYVASVPRYPGATATVTGGAYPTSAN